MKAVLRMEPQMCPSCGGQDSVRPRQARAHAAAAARELAGAPSDRDLSHAGSGSADLSPVSREGSFLSRAPALQVGVFVKTRAQGCGEGGEGTDLTPERLARGSVTQRKAGAFRQRWALSPPPGNRYPLCRHRSHLGALSKRQAPPNPVT